MFSLGRSLCIEYSKSDIQPLLLFCVIWIHIQFYSYKEHNLKMYKLNNLVFNFIILNIENTKAENKVARIDDKCRNA